MVEPTPRAAVLARVAGLLPEVRRPLLMVVDGPDGVGKTRFANDLASLLGERGRPTARASVDDFHHPRAHRHALGRTPESVWTRHFDYQSLRRELLDPWLAGPGATYVSTWHDVRRDEYARAPRESVPAHGVLVVDGVFAQRPEISQAWDLVVFLDAPPEVTVARLAARDGSPNDVGHPDQRRYLDAQRLYLDTCGPQRQADVLVDNSDLDSPRFVEPDHDELPPGWTAEGEEIVRTVRLPCSATDSAYAVNEAARSGPHHEPGVAP